MSNKMLDDLKGEIALHDPKIHMRIAAFILVLADRIASLGGDVVKASDLATVLRMDPESLGELIATNPPEVELAPATLNPSVDGMKNPEPVKPDPAPWVDTSNPAPKV